MLCKHCEAEIPSSWGKVVFKNVCPACDKSILSNQELSCLIEIKSELNELKPFTLENISAFVYNKYIKNLQESKSQNQEDLDAKSELTNAALQIENGVGNLDLSENAASELDDKSDADSALVEKEEGKPLLSQDRANVFVKRSGVKPIKKSEITKKPSSFSDIIKEIQESDSDIFANAPQQFDDDTDSSAATLPTGEDLSSLFENS